MSKERLDPKAPRLDANGNPKNDVEARLLALGYAKKAAVSETIEAIQMEFPDDSVIAAEN
jgi:hypothetical protein